MRYGILCLGLLAGAPASAWDFTPGPICKLSDVSTEGDVTVTFDPAISESSITLTLPNGRWPEAPTFVMVFSGDRPITIQTSQHRISPDGRTLTVKDRGFGNVLNGMQGNPRAYASLGNMTMAIGLTGIEPAITAFRNCPADNLM